MPSFSASRITAFNAASFAMRGVGLTDIIVYQDSPVAVNIDDFVMPSVQTQLLDTFDIERVEVLRGPQGTLFGKNTTGGLVNITTKKPSLEEGSVELRAMGGSFGRYQLQGAVDLPVGDTLGLRFVGNYNQSDGYYENGATAASTPMRVQGSLDVPIVEDVCAMRLRRPVKAKSDGYYKLGGPTVRSTRSAPSTRCAIRSTTSRA